jgi:hypothetical protein
MLTITLGCCVGLAPDPNFFLNTEVSPYTTEGSLGDDSLREINRRSLALLLEVLVQLRSNNIVDHEAVRMTHGIFVSR